MEKIEIGNGLMVNDWDYMENPYKYLEMGYYVLSLKSEMTEEKARQVVNQATVYKRVLYLNYTDTEYWYKKALESFNSFCTANNLQGEYVVLIKTNQND